MPGKGVRIGKEEIGYINFFEGVTGARVKDCVIDQKRDRVILIVSQGQMGLAIGYRGKNLRKLQDMTGKQYEIVEYFDEIVPFLKNMLKPVKPREIRVAGFGGKSKVLTIIVNPRDRGFTIGKNGRNIDKISMLARRYFDIDKVRVVVS